MKAINTPRGLVNFPDDMSDEDIAGVLRREFPPGKIPYVQATPEKQSDLGPQTSQMLGAYKGAVKPLDNLASGAKWLANQIPSPAPGVQPLGTAIDQIGGMMGMPSTEDAVAGHAQYIADQEKRGIVPGKIGEVAGEIAGTLPTMFLPGGPLAQGAATGALLTDSHDPAAIALDTGLGGVGGVLGDRLIKGASGIVAPLVRKGVRSLLDAGVDLTPGQITGGSMKWLEDKATSWPLVGAPIKNAQNRAVKSLNVAAVNKALAPIGASVPAKTEPGRQLIDQAHQLVSNSYNRLLPQLVVRPDPTFVREVSNLQALSRGLVPDMRTKFDQNLNDVLAKFTGSGAMSGQTMKNLESDLGQTARQFSHSSVSSEREYGTAIRELVEQLRRVTERTNPQFKGELKAINRSFAQLATIERAAGGVGAVNGQVAGVFSAPQLQSAVRAGDPTARKNAFSRGRALMQDLSDPAREILPSTIPNSGTADRTLPFALAAEVTPHLFGGGMSPETTAAMSSLGLTAAGSHAAYSPLGTKFLQQLLARKPGQRAQALAAAIARLRIPAQTLGAVGAASAPSLLGSQ